MLNYGRVEYELLLAYRTTVLGGLGIIGVYRTRRTGSYRGVAPGMVGYMGNLETGEMTTPLYQWAARWGLPAACLNDLLATLGAAVPTPPPTATPGPDRSEAGIQSERVLRAARNNGWLLRNNSGALQDKTGRLVRYGLGHTSAQVSKVMKSSDLIGVQSVVVTPQMVGSTVGLFLAEEVKHPGWVYLGDRPCICKPGKSLCDYCHQKAQMNFIMKVLSLGGIARFVNDPEA
jgi:hypothetical protein